MNAGEEQSKGESRVKIGIGGRTSNCSRSINIYAGCCYREATTVPIQRPNIGGKGRAKLLRRHKKG